MPKKSISNSSKSKKKSQSKRKKTRKELKQKAVNYKGGECEICGYSKCLAALTFHHRNPDEKDFGISEIINIINWSKIKRELNKTHLLCVRCHQEVHHGYIDGYID